MFQTSKQVTVGRTLTLLLQVYVNPEFSPIKRNYKHKEMLSTTLGIAGNSRGRQVTETTGPRTGGLAVEGRVVAMWGARGAYHSGVPEIPRNTSDFPLGRAAFEARKPPHPGAPACWSRLREARHNSALLPQPESSQTSARAGAAAFLLAGIYENAAGLHVATDPVCECACTWGDGGARTGHSGELRPRLRLQTLCRKRRSGSRCHGAHVFQTRRRNTMRPLQCPVLSKPGRPVGPFLRAFRPRN